MDAKLIRELKKTLTREETTIVDIGTGCIKTDGEQAVFENYQTKNLMNLEKEESLKYFAFFQKMMGQVGTKLIEVDINNEDVEKLLTSIVSTDIKSNVNILFEEIAKKYNGIDSLATFIVKGAYDRKVRTEDNIKNDESDIVYSHLICTLNPIKTVYPGIILNSDGSFSNAPTIGRVEDPICGFLYPSFDGEGVDYSKAMVYFSKPSEKNVITDLFNSGSVNIEEKNTKKTSKKKNEDVDVIGVSELSDVEEFNEVNTSENITAAVIPGVNISKTDDNKYTGYTGFSENEDKIEESNINSIDSGKEILEKLDKEEQSGYNKSFSNFMSSLTSNYSKDDNQPSDNDILLSCAKAPQKRYTKWNKDGSASFTADPVRCAKKLAKYEDLGTVEELKEKIKE